MNKTNKYGFLIFYAACFFVVLFKAITIPITHDECATTVHYSTYSYWEILMYPDSWPNNHILNTLSVKWLITTFTKEQWIVRIPNLIGFWIYAYGIYLFLKLVFKPDSKLFLFGALIFVLNFYLIDFFSLSRGYGLSCAFVTISAVYILKSFIEKKDMYIWLAIALAIIGSYANFTSLIYVMCSCLMFTLYFFQKNNYKLKIISWNNFILLLICAGYGALIANPIIKMKQDDQFKYWTSKGFVEESVITTVDHFKYGSYDLNQYDSYIISIIIISLVIFIELFWIFRIIKHKAIKEVFENPVFLSNTILLLTALISILNCKLTNTPNLNGRTALLFYPLFALVICSLVAALNKIHLIPQLIVGFSILWFSTWHFKDTFSFKSVREWWFDENTFQVVEFLRNDAKCEQINLRTNWLFHPSFYFYVYTGKFTKFNLHNYNKEVDVNSDADYYYVLGEDVAKLEANYYKVASFDNARFILKRKK
jgi:hypothetical protein